MVGLAGINALALVLFGAAYGAGALRWLSQGAFLGSLVVVFGAVTALWIHTIRQGKGGHTPVERLGRAALGLVAVVVLAPIVVLAPLFALHQQLPPEAGAEHFTGRVMVLLLASLALVALTNVAGALYLLLAAFGGRLRRRSGPPAA